MFGIPPCDDDQPWHETLSVIVLPKYFSGDKVLTWTERKLKGLPVNDHV